jgi:hypothetical protein
MAFLIATGGMTLVVIIGTFLLLRAEKKEKERMYPIGMDL